MIEPHFRGVGGVLTLTDWSTVAKAYDEIARGERTRRRQGELTEEIAADITAAALAVAQATTALSPYALGIDEDLTPGDRAALAAAALQGAPAVQQANPGEPEDG